MVEPTTSEILPALRAVRSVVAAFSHSPLLPRIDEEIRKLESQSFHLVVLGQFKRGKTTFVNALLEEELLPVGVLPVTSVVTLIRSGREKRCDVLFADQHRETIAPARLHEYVTERGNPENQKQVRAVELEHPASFLREGVTLVDTPGIGSLALHNTDRTLEFIPNIDAAVVVLSADLPITQAESEFLREVLKHVGTLFFVLNKSDLVPERERRELLVYAREALAGQFPGREIVIIPLSARLALEGYLSGSAEKIRASNIQAFLEAIQAFVREHRQAVLERRSADRLRAFLGEARFAIELELRALTAPLDKVRSTIAEFNQQVIHLMKEREEFVFLLDGRIHALNRWIEEELARFATTEQARLHGTLTQWASLHGNLSAEEFRTQIHDLLAAELVRDLDAWRSANEPRIVERYDEILSTLVARTNEYIRRVLQLSVDMFQIPLQPFEEIPPIRWTGSFRYTMEDDPLFLELDTQRASSVLLPRAVAQKRALRSALDDAADKLMRHTGKLRYEYAYSIQESTRTFRFALDAKLDSIIKQIQETVHAATELRAHEEEALAGRTQILRERLEQLNTIANGSFVANAERSPA